MEDRSNIIKEAIEYRDKLEKKVEELTQSVVRLLISLDFADNTIKKKDRENAELKAELQKYKDMETKGLEEFKDVGGCLGCGLQLQLNQDLKDIKQLKAENERLKEEKGGMQILIDNYIALTEQYHQTLQEIKEIAENICRDDCPDLKFGYCIGLGECSFRARKQILDLITKAESEEV